MINVFPYWLLWIQISHQILLLGLKEKFCKLRTPTLQSFNLVLSTKVMRSGQNHSICVYQRRLLKISVLDANPYINLGKPSKNTPKLWFLAQPLLTLLPPLETWAP